MKQASATADTYMRDAKKDIDVLFGPGYAQEHPELVGAYMQAASTDYAAWSLSLEMHHIRERLDRAPSYTTGSSHDRVAAGLSYSVLWTW